MKRIGIIGGLGPEATIDYYRTIIKTYQDKTNGEYPELIIYSMNMKEFSCAMTATSADKTINWLSRALHAVHRGGADFALIASNTPHIVFYDLQALSPIPLLSIVEETCKVASQVNLKKVALLGTKVTMSSDFYHRVFTENGIEIITPQEAEREYINDKLLSEIIHNKIFEQTKRDLLKIIKRMIDESHIQGVILGCTELPLILTGDEFGIPFLNTAKIHAESAVRFSIGEA